MATTPNYQLPYPLPTAPVANGADDIKALAERLDSVVLPAQATDAEVAAAYIAKALADAKGDLLAATGPDAFGRLPVGADGKILAAQAAAATGLAWIDPPAGGGGAGAQLAYQELTANVTVPVSTPAAAVTVVAAPSIALDGSTPIIIEFFAPSIALAAPVAGGQTEMHISLWYASTNLGDLGVALSNIGVTGYTAHSHLSRRRLTPSAGSFAFVIKAYLVSGNPSLFQVGNGGVGVYLPGYVRITRA